ncbi:MAG: GNAT family N-acetyltransferase [Dehalococcoidia bacterium]
MSELRYEVHGAIDRVALQQLFDASWEGSGPQYGSEFDYLLSWVCAYEGAALVGFVSVAWNGGGHAFLLDTTVHPDHRRRGVGVELVRLATDAARDAGCEWLHVDYEAVLGRFYQECGFTESAAAVMRL